MIYDALLGDPAVDEHLSDDAHVDAMLQVEEALARAQATLGLIPESAADVITDSTREDEYDLDSLAAGAAKAGNLAIPLVQALTANAARRDPVSARYVHWGATSQDIIDTATVLQLRAAVSLVADSLARAADAAAELAERHATTVMAGRTWLQHATPITFGLKAAGWLAALDRVHERVEFALDDAMFLQFGGASGTLGSYDDRGLELTALLADGLALRQTNIPWHAHRDRLADLACALGVAVGTTGKIARDISLLSQTEVAEAFEPAEEGKGGSSAMPQKRNPVGASVVLAASIRVPGLVATMLAAMPNEHERALGGWQAEWETLPQIVHLAGGAARHTAEMLAGLEIDAERMRANIDLTQGVSLAESASMALAEHIGRFDAHRVIGDASRRAIAEHRPLADVLAEAPDVMKHLSREEIARLLTPGNYLGSSATFIADALAAHATYRDVD
ncbi:MAG: 3-carboxy-cis,cis-muconate cycloisomerase [Gemmatimonadaceae bacterium]|nr:3-carboxy-cis,cis-muconate cycloisomerase [Gemmatimonadaceae bacterium]